MVWLTLHLTSIVSDNLEPGAKRLADTTISDGIDRNAANIAQQQQSFLDRVGSAVGGVVDAIGSAVGNAISAVGGFFSNVLSNTGLFSGKEEIRNIDPLVADLNGDGVKLTHYNDSQAVFDVDNDGYAENTGWVNKNDGIIVHDVDGDGKINDITETISEFYGAEKGSGQNENFADGLDALASLDSNNDGKFDANDEAFSTLKVWHDKDGDAETDVGELKTLTEAGMNLLILIRKFQTEKD